MTGTLIKKKTSKSQEYYYVNLSYKDPETGEWKIKMVSTGLPVKNNKRKAETLIPGMLEKYAYLESSIPQHTHIDKNITLCDYMDLWIAGKKTGDQARHL